jgi:hypothetical protein
VSILIRGPIVASTTSVRSETCHDVDEAKIVIDPRLSLSTRLITREYLPVLLLFMITH